MHNLMTDVNDQLMTKHWSFGMLLVSICTLYNWLDSRCDTACCHRWLLLSLKACWYTALCILLGITWAPLSLLAHSPLDYWRCLSNRECQTGISMHRWHGNCAFIREGVIWHAKQTSFFLPLRNPEGRFPYTVLTLIVTGKSKIISKPY